MAIYVIGYDLHPKQGETYGELIKVIQDVGTNWWHCLDSTWLVVTNKSAVQVRDELKRHLKRDDQLIVVMYSPHQSAWFGFNDECSKWLKDNM